MTKKIEDGDLPEDLIDAAAAICRGLGIASTPTNCFPIIKGIHEDRQRDQWQPIKTAPKDGSAILVGHESSVFDAWWEPDGRETDTGKPGWIDGTMNNIEEYITYQPTHWMQLPSPPRALDQKGSSNG